MSHNGHCLSPLARLAETVEPSFSNNSCDAGWLLTLEHMHHEDLPDVMYIRKVVTYCSLSLFILNGVEKQNKIHQDYDSRKNLYGLGQLAYKKVHLDKY